MSTPLAERTVIYRSFRNLQMNSLSFVDGIIDPDVEMLGLAVATSAATLDEIAPGWHERVTEEIDMANCRLCVLGQAFNHLPPARLGARGFSMGMEYIRDNGHEPMPFVFTHHKAAPFWEAEIARRRTG